MEKREAEVSSDARAAVRGLLHEVRRGRLALGLQGSRFRERRVLRIGQRRQLARQHQPQARQVAEAARQRRGVLVGRIAVPAREWGINWIPLMLEMALENVGDSKSQA